MTTILAALGVALFFAAALSVALVRYVNRTGWDRCARLDCELSHRDRDVQP